MKTFFFDLDGTLSDSRGGLYVSFRRGLAALGVAALSDAVLAPFLGTPLPDVFRALKPDVSDEEIARGMAAFRAAFEAEGLFISPLYPRVEAMLQTLKARGGAAWVVTSKPEKYAVQVVEHLAIAGYFDGVIGAGLDETDTKQGLIARALVASGARSVDATMLGDRHYDVIGALANRVRPVGALWGYGSKRELVEAGCIEFANDVDAFAKGL